MNVYLYPWELNSMPEYSHTIPSAHVPGKWWKSRQLISNAARANELWVGTFTMTEYDTEIVEIKFFPVVMRQGPQPPNWKAPDWGNFAEYRRIMMREGK